MKKKKGLVKRVALITGASQGIGKAIARALGEAGMTVVLCSRRRAMLNSVKKEFEDYGIIAHIAVADVAQSDQVKKIFKTIIKKLGRLDVLVNNAGSTGTFGGFFDLADADWHAAFNANFMSAVYCVREAIPLLKKAEHPRIINISAVPARQPGVFNPHYSASKAALLNLNKYLATLLAQDAILVNAICPGTIIAENWYERARHRAERMQIPLETAMTMMKNEDERKSPLGRLGTPEDVAAVASFLASPHAGFITGACIDVDGGVTRSIF